MTDAPRFNDRIISEGFPDGWYVQDRLDDGTALLCRRTEVWPSNRCVCVRPRATPTDAWLPTARRIAEGYARADLAPSHDVETAYARGFHDAQHKAKLEGRLVIVDSPEIRALVEALRALDKAASEVARRGAETGPQWSKLTIASLNANAALAAYEKETRHD